MAKRPLRKAEDAPVLLALKTELWQSCTVNGANMDTVLLALKTELWQSKDEVEADEFVVLLALKTELWQSEQW